MLGRGGQHDVLGGESGGTTGSTTTGSTTTTGTEGPGSDEGGSENRCGTPDLATTMIVTVLDTCGDDDCCTENRGDADLLIDLESHTNERWGLDDGDLQWADLGPTQSAECG